jgi:hypothetical protein
VYIDGTEATWFLVLIDLRFMPCKSKKKYLKEIKKAQFIHSELL